MSQQIRLYYKSVTADIIGPEHGLSRDDMAQYAEPIGKIVTEMHHQAGEGKLPYRKLPYDTAMLDQARELACELHAWCRNFVVLGIGGSALGNIALQTALSHPFYNLLDDENRPGPRLFVMDNVDPVQFASLLELLEPELDATVFNIISKSGQTAETAAQFLVVRQLLAEKLGKDALGKHIVATTDPTSGALREIAERDGLRTLEVPDGVGGRFSVLSHVGLLSASICDIDTEQLMAGARDMDDRVSNPDLWKNPAALFALIQFLFYQRNKHLAVMFPYSAQLRDLSDWFRQLWAESLGKAKTLDGKTMHIGPTPINALGVTDQHSQVQLYRDGPNDKLFTFLRVKHFANPCPIPAELTDADAYTYLGHKSFTELLNAEKIATEYALVDSHRPCLTIDFPEVNPYTVGQFIYMLETATSITGNLLNINPYDQPAVELGKKATFALMGRPGYDELASDLGKFAQIDDSFLV